MTRMVIGPILLLAAMVSPEARPAAPALQRVAHFQPTGGAAARATVSVRIVSAVRFGPGRGEQAAGATRRRVRLTEYDGAVTSAELLEFQ